MNGDPAVVALGQVDFLHPAFHDEKFIYPVGYSAIRITSSAASGNRPLPHLCEILAAEDGSGPFFRCAPLYSHLQIYATHENYLSVESVLFFVLS